MTAKYRSKRTMVDNILFSSKKEAARYCELKAMWKSGIIHGLSLQIPFPLIVNGKTIAKYVADFVYYTPENIRVIEDVKGFRTPVYKLKKKIMEAMGYHIKES